MKQSTIHHGSRQVIITEQGPTRFAARLYVNQGETATLTCWKGTTLKGAQQWAKKVLAR
jgi:hypothetical protein